MNNNVKEEMITGDKHPEIYDWLLKNVGNYQYQSMQQAYNLTSDNKINVYDSISFNQKIKQFKYPFGYVKGNFTCEYCSSLTSLIGSPKEIGGDFNFINCHNITSLIGMTKEIKGCFKIRSCESLNSIVGFPKYIGDLIRFSYTNFSNDPKYKQTYKPYLAMWIELLESVDNEERFEYINNYKDKKTGINPVIPIEIMKEYGF